MSPGRRSSLFLLFSGLLWLVGRADLEAVSGRWESVGPDSGALVQLLAVSPSATATVYATVAQYSPYGGLASSIFRTDDRGQSWRPLARRLPQISSLALDPVSPSIAYIGTATGIFKTTNGGIRWEPISKGLDSLDINSLAIDPLSTSILFAGANAPTIPGSDKGAGGVFKSIDGGLTWRKSSTGIPENAFGFLSARLVTVAPSSPATIYTVNTEGINKSVDAGSNWSLVNPLPGDYTFSRAVDPNSPSTVYLGAQYAVLKTTDGGVTWKRIEQGSGLPFELIRSLAADPVSPLTIYAGTQDGLAKTTDGGTSWVPLANGPRGAAGGVAFAIDPRNPSVLYANGSKSTDGGATWTPANSGLRKMGVSSIVVSPGPSPFVYAAGGGEGGTGVFKSSDRGSTWSQTGTGLPDLTIFSLAEDPFSEGTLFAGTGDGLYKTTDGAITWVRLPSAPNDRAPWVTSIAVDPQNSSTVYAATRPVYIGLGNYAGGGVLKTTNGGDSWTTLSNSLVERSTGPIGIDPHEPSTLYIASGDTLFKSIDGGASTLPLSFGINPGFVVTSVAIDDRESAVYAGTLGAGIFKSTDGGSNWTRINQGLTELWVETIAIDRSAPATLYAGTRGGVFRSDDAGLTWHFFSAGLTDSGIKSLAITFGGAKTIYAGTGDDSVFRLDLSSSSLPMPASPRVLTPRG